MGTDCLSSLQPALECGGNGTGEGGHEALHENQQQTLIALPFAEWEVRNHRLKQLEAERHKREELVPKQGEASFELVPLVVVQVQGGRPDD